MESNMKWTEGQRKVLVRALFAVALGMAVLMVITNKKPCPSVPVLTVAPGETSLGALGYCVFVKEVDARGFKGYVRHTPLNVCAATRKEALVLQSLHQSVQQQKHAACLAKDTSLLGRMLGRS